MALQPDGKIVMAGGTLQDFILARFNADGSIDRSFGFLVDGTVTTDMGSGFIVEEATAVAVQADGSSVTTLEGLAVNGALHPMQTAYWENHGLQCGFCTPGMIMAATCLLQKNTKPTEAETEQALEGNLCRCTGYVHIVDAVQQAAAAMNGGAR